MARIAFTPDVSAGAVLQVSVVLVGLITWAVTNAGKADRTQESFVAFRDTVTEQLRGTRVEVSGLVAQVSGSVQELRREIQSLPDYRAKMDQAERRLDQTDTRIGLLESRLGSVERMAIELRSDLNNISRASAAPLPGARTAGPRP